MTEAASALPRDRAVSGAVFCSHEEAPPTTHDDSHLPAASAGSSHHARGVWLMLLSATCFTINVLLTRALGEMQTVSVWLICTVRFVVGIGMVAVLYRREVRPSHLFLNRKLVERGLVGGLTVVGFYLTILRLGAGRATFINTTYVVFGGLLAMWILGERFRIAIAAGGGIALAGLALLTGAFGADSQASLYDLVGIVTALGSAWVVVTIRQLHATEHTATIFAAQCVYGLLVCIVPAVIHWQALSAPAVGVLLLVSICVSVGQIAMTLSFRDLPVAEGSLLQMLVPVGIGLGGALLFNEHFTSAELAGAGLILAGTAITLLRR
ncbi:MAG: DMT family transporter [Opitutaceae bacterium]